MSIQVKVVVSGYFHVSLNFAGIRTYPFELHHQLVGHLAQFVPLFGVGSLLAGVAEHAFHLVRPEEVLDQGVDIHRVFLEPVHRIDVVPHCFSVLFEIKR